jgi:hypothetical protein
MRIDILGYILRFVFLVALQVLVFNHIHLFDFVTPFVYIVFLITLPVEFTGGLLLLVAFGLGFSVDLFTNTLGMHASACVMAAFVRPFILNLTAPRDGYEFGVKPSIQELGIGWFLTFSSLLIIIHHFTLYLVEVLRFTELFRVLGKALASGVLTLIIITVLQLLNSKNTRDK